MTEQSVIKAVANFIAVMKPSNWEEMAVAAQIIAAPYFETAAQISDTTDTDRATLRSSADMATDVYWGARYASCLPADLKPIETDFADAHIVTKTIEDIIPIGVLLNDTAKILTEPEGQQRSAHEEVKLLQARINSLFAQYAAFQEPFGGTTIIAPHSGTIVKTLAEGQTQPLHPQAARIIESALLKLTLGL